MENGLAQPNRKKEARYEENISCLTITPIYSNIIYFSRPYDLYVIVYK